MTVTENVHSAQHPEIVQRIHAHVHPNAQVIPNGHQDPAQPQPNVVTARNQQP